MRIYVSRPLSTDKKGNPVPVTVYIQNCHQMMMTAIALREMGHFPYVPCLDILLGFVDGQWEYKDFADINMSFLEVCDAIFFLGHSKGADAELERATALGKQVFKKWEEVPDA